MNEAVIEEIIDGLDALAILKRQLAGGGDDRLVPVDGSGRVDDSIRFATIRNETWARIPEAWVKLTEQQYALVLRLARGAVSTEGAAGAVPLAPIADDVDDLWCGDD